MNGILERQWSRKKKLCIGVKKVRKFTYLRDRVSAGGGCEVAVTAKTTYGLLWFREYSELLYGRFPLKLKGAVCDSYVSPAILCGNEAWCLKETNMTIL